MDTNLTYLNVQKALNVGGGTDITQLAVYSVELSPVAVAANTTAEQDLTVTGLTTDDKILSINKPTAQAGLGIVGFRVKAADTLAVTFVNATAAEITPTAEEVYIIIAIRS